MSELDRLRNRIREIDAQVLRLVRERMDCAAEVGRAKKQQGVPLRDWQVERAVLDHAESLASQLNLSPILARSLMQALIAESRAEQERLTYSNYSGEAERILVVGGRGKMGRWFVDFFADQGHRVTVYDVASSSPGAAPSIVSADLNDAAPAGPSPESAVRTVDRLESALADSDFVVIATSLETVGESIDQIVATGYRGILFDVASLKGHLKAAIERASAAGVCVTSIHPMFGPATKALSGQVICLCDCGDATATRRIRAFFSDTAATLVELSLDEHDRIISFVLGLSHLINLLFARVLREGGGSFEALNRVGSTTFHSQMATTSAVLRDNPELYYAIQKLNPYTGELYESLSRELGRLTDAVRRGDREDFVRQMCEGRDWIGR